MMNTQNNIQAYLPTFYNRLMSEEQDRNAIDKCNSDDLTKRLGNGIEAYLEKNNIQYDKFDKENFLNHNIKQKKHYENHVVSLLRKANIIDINPDAYIPDICNQFCIIDLYTQFLLEENSDIKELIIIIIRVLIEASEKEYDNVRQLFNGSLNIWGSEGVNKVNWLRGIIENILHTLVFPNYIQDKNKEKILIEFHSIFSRIWNTSFFTYCGVRNISREKIVDAMKYNPNFPIFRNLSCNAIFKLWLKEDETFIQKLPITPETRNLIVESILGSCINHSDVQLVANTINHYNLSSISNYILQDLIRLFVEYEMYDEAEKAFEKMNDLIWVPPAFFILGVHLKDIEATINGKKNCMKPDEAWKIIAIKYAEVGKFAEAEATVEKIEDMKRKNSAWSRIAIKYAEAGKFAEAEATLEKIEDMESKNSAWRIIAVKYAEAGKSAEAEATLEKIEDMESKNSAWRIIAVKYAEVGKSAEAEATVEKIEDISGKDSCWQKIGEVYIKAKNYRAAELLVYKMSTSEPKQKIVYSIITDSIRNGITDDFIETLMKNYLPDNEDLHLAFQVQRNKKNNKNLNIDDIKDFVKKETNYLLK